MLTLVKYPLKKNIPKLNNYNPLLQKKQKTYISVFSTLIQIHNNYIIFSAKVSKTCRLIRFLVRVVYTSNCNNNGNNIYKTRAGTYVRRHVLTKHYTNWFCKRKISVWKIESHPTHVNDDDGRRPRRR